MSLKDYRDKIDHIDQRILSCLNERAQLSQTIGQEKKKQNKGIYSPDREQEVLRRLKALNQGPMTNDAIEAIYREVMSSSLSLEEALKIAYLGTPGSYTHGAATAKFGSQVEYIACGSISEVFHKVEAADCHYGVVPIENSTEGAVTHTFDLLVDSDLKICAESTREISHALMSHSPMDKIKKIYSNPQVFGQCRNWLLEHLPSVGQISVASTTLAAQMAAKEKDAAAIASREAAKIYHVPVLRRDIQDIAHNITRFLVIARQDVRPTGHDRTSILFSIRDKVGALHAMLTPFFKHKINLTKIESRPSKKKAWDYFFFVDFEGHRDDPKVKRALDELEDMCKYLKVLGSYPMVDDNEKTG